MKIHVFRILMFAQTLLSISTCCSEEINAQTNILPCACTAHSDAFVAIRHAVMLTGFSLFIITHIIKLFALSSLVFLIYCVQLLQHAVNLDANAPMSI